ncbi:unnamed protein product [Phaedon cochleariae]|uniref:YAP binding domain-containing protein n=1 Tax=Phaedon cochleariae TaxID=80249 RepID=A0A9N9SJ16_PHACE|nr:unnamed protein product [Phaedon cochleariae]
MGDYFFRMKKTWQLRMRREFGVRISNKVFKKLSRSTRPVEDEKSSCQMKEKCMHRASRYNTAGGGTRRAAGAEKGRRVEPKGVRVRARNYVKNVQLVRWERASFLWGGDHVAKEKALQTMSSMSSAQIVSATTAMHSKSAALNIGLTHNSHNPVSYPGAQFWQPGLQPGTSQDVKPFAQAAYTGKPATAVSAGDVGAGLQTAPPPVWEGRAIATHKLRLVEFSAFMESQSRDEAYQKHLFVHIGGPASYTDPLLEAVDVRQIYDKFPEKKGGLKELYDKGPQNAFFLVKFWADLNSNLQDEAGAFYGVTSSYESNENMTITCSTKVCSFGKQVVEKVETEYARYENGRFVYRIHRSPMCEYMINFIHKLKHLPEKYMMNSVLENFTILQVVSNRDTQETLLCTAYVFEVSTSEHGAQHHIYRLVKD